MTILNPAPAQSGAAAPEVLRLVDVLTPNQGEAAALVNREVRNIDHAVAAARSLRERGCGAVIVTMGALGCVVVDDSVDHVPAPKVRAIDTTAAGDAFNGALAVALAEGKSLLAAARWATRAAALSVMRAGAQPSLPRRDEIESFVAS